MGVDAVDLARQFARLTPPADATSDLRFSAEPIEQYPRHRIAVDRHGLPTLLISVCDARGAGPPLVLEHLRMQQGVDCSVTEPDGASQTRRFTILRCTDDDPDTREYFLRIGGTVVDAVGDKPTSHRVSETIERLVELFRALTAPPRKPVMGLWGELFLIAYSWEPAVLVGAWHAQPEERFDFCLGSHRLEVKAALGRLRRHHFALEQLTPVSGADVLIASLLLERSVGGPSVAELIAEVRSAVSDDANAVLHVDTVVARTLGSTWRRAMEERFDAELAASGLAFFLPSAIPKPDGPIPPAVTDVRFVSDLSGCPPAGTGGHQSGAGLLASAIRRRHRVAARRLGSM